MLWNGKRRNRDLLIRKKIIKFRKPSYGEILKNFVFVKDQNQVNKNYIIENDRIRKKYLTHEDPETYTKSRRYINLLKNIIKTKSKVLKETKYLREQTNLYNSKQMESYKKSSKLLVLQRTKAISSGALSSVSPSINTTPVTLKRLQRQDTSTQGSLRKSKILVKFKATIDF